MVAVWKRGGGVSAFDCIKPTSARIYIYKLKRLWVPRDLKFRKLLLCGILRMVVVVVGGNDDYESFADSNTLPKVLLLLARARSYVSLLHLYTHTHTYTRERERASKPDIVICATFFCAHTLGAIRRDINPDNRPPFLPQYHFFLLLKICLLIFFT